jgi:hypothetical protein
MGSRSGRTPSTDQNIYLATVMLGAASTGALVGPVSLHRLLTGRRLKPQTVDWASRITLIGMFLLLCTMVSALLLILRLVLPGALAVWLVLGMAVWFLLCWIVLPLWLRARYQARSPLEPPSGSGGGTARAGH